MCVCVRVFSLCVYMCVVGVCVHVNHSHTCTPHTHTHAHTHTCTCTHTHSAGAEDLLEEEAVHVSPVVSLQSIAFVPPFLDFGQQ